jgi:hypothetical protein
VIDPNTVLGRPSNDSDPDSDAPPTWNAAQGTCQATFAASPDSDPEHLRIVAAIPQPGFLVLKLRTFPAWRLEVNGAATVPMPARADGLMAVPVLAGQNTVTADWTTTSDVLLGRWLSALSVLALIGLLFLARRPLRQRLK